MGRRALETALVVALTGCGPGSAADLPEWTPADHQQEAADDSRGAPPEVDQDPATTELRAATSLFGALCASCHGASGAGDGPGRPPVAQVPDFTDGVFLASRSDEALATAIREGRGGFMPAFGDRLSPEGVAALVRHVRRLGEPSPTAP